MAYQIMEAQETTDLKEIYEGFKSQYEGIEDFSASDADMVVSMIKSRILTILHEKRLANMPQESTSRDKLIYGGITNNISNNLSRHNIQQYLICLFVDSFATAEIIERKMGTVLEFCIGKNGASSAGRGGKDTDDETASRVVYVADMTLPGFKK